MGLLCITNIINIINFVDKTDHFVIPSTDT